MLFDDTFRAADSHLYHSLVRLGKVSELAAEDRDTSSTGNRSTGRIELYIRITYY